MCLIDRDWQHCRIDGGDDVGVVDDAVQDADAEAAADVADEDGAMNRLTNVGALLVVLAMVAEVDVVVVVVAVADGVGDDDDDGVVSVTALLMLMALSVGLHYSNDVFHFH